MEIPRLSRLVTTPLGVPATSHIYASALVVYHKNGRLQVFFCNLLFLFLSRYQLHICAFFQAQFIAIQSTSDPTPLQEKITS